MKNKQTLRMKAPNILFVGPPLVGKTTLKERIIKGPSWVVSPKSSTPIVAAPISVVPKKLSPDVVALSKSCWTQLELEEQKAFIVLRASEQVPVYQLAHTEKELPAFQKQFKQERMEIANVSDRQNTLLTSKTIYSSQQSLQSLPENQHAEIATSTLCKDHTAQCFPPSFDDLFREVLPGCIPSSQVYKRLQDVLHGSSIVQMLDTGGQPAFLEVLPALLSGQSINLLVFKLNERLNDRYKVHYNSPDGKATESYDSSFTVEDVLFQAISSVSFRIAPPFVTKGLTLTSLPSKTIFVGTHMDQVSDYSVVKTTSDILQQKLKCTEIPELDFMNCSTEIGNSVIVPIDNTSPTDPGIHILQDMLDMIMKKDFPDIEFPLSWLMFYFTIRSKKVKFISFEECVQIGKHYSIDEEEIRLALWYLSCFFGTLRWYPEVGDIVICDIQVVFDSITNLISRTFYSKYCTTSEIEFKRTGQILVSKAENLLAECSPIPLPQLVKLLEWLHILTPMYKAGKVHKYFLPCVLPSFPVEDMTSHAITSHHPIPLLFTFEFGYCPIGLFSALVVHLASIKDDSGMMWMLCDSEHGLYRNKITYYVGKDYDEVTLIARPTFYEVTVVERKRNRRQEHLHDVCEKIQSTINAAISRVKVSRTSPLELAHYCAFYCTNCHDTNVPHTAKVLELSSGLATCSFKNTIIELSPEHLIWFGQAHSTQILKENDLDKLYDIVRNTAPRWKTIGLALGFLQSELEIIEMKPLLIPIGVTAYLQEMLHCWLKWSPPKHCFPTTESLANALRAAGEEATAHNLPKLMETITTTPLQQANNSWTEVESTKV